MNSWFNIQEKRDRGIKKTDTDTNKKTLRHIFTRERLTSSISLDNLAPS